MKPIRRVRAFSVTELLVIIGIIVLLALLAFPAFEKMQGHGNSAKCVSNLRQIGSATALYIAEHQNELSFYYYQPSEGASGSGAVPGTWFYNLAPYLSVPRTEVNDPAIASEERTLLGTSSRGISGPCVFTCPSHGRNESPEKWSPKPMTFPTRIPVSYAPTLTLGASLVTSSQSRGTLHPSGYIMYPLRLQEIVAPSKKIWLMDSPMPHFLNASSSRWAKDRENTYNYPYQAFTRHEGEGNALFFDGHVERLPLATFTEYPLGIDKALLRYFNPLREPSMDE